MTDGPVGRRAAACCWSRQRELVAAPEWPGIFFSKTGSVDRSGTGCRDGQTDSATWDFFSYGLAQWASGPILNVNRIRNI